MENSLSVISDSGRGRLVVVALPIGNLGDITSRALEALRQGRIFIAEDTRNLKKLMGLLGIIFSEKKFFSLHDHSSPEKVERLMQIILETSGKEIVYLVSDAGTPLVADPGYELVSTACQRGIEVDAYPGPSALINAACLSGFPAIPLHFHGFLPRSLRQVQQEFLAFKTLAGQHVFFESIHRAQKTLQLMATVFAQDRVFVGREMTKKFQSCFRGHGAELKNWLDEAPMKGELTIAVFIEKNLSQQINFSTDSEECQLAEKLLVAMREGTPYKKILAKILAKLLGTEVNEIYKQIN